MSDDSAQSVRVAVVGGTGVVGRHVTEALRAAGQHPVILARSVGVDLVTGRGLDAALAEVASVIDVSNVTAARRSAAVRFFETATSHLLAAGQRAGVSHHVVLSIVGIDRVDLGYYAGKRRQEEVALAGSLPVTVLRATQFHEFAEQFVRGSSPIVLAPRMLSQPVAAREVAQRLVELVAAPAIDRAPDFAGPQSERMPELVRRLLAARGSRRRVLAVRVPGRAGRAMAAGGLLPVSPGPHGEQTFADWLAGPDCKPLS